jgi:hypothetical protein
MHWHIFIFSVLACIESTFQPTSTYLQYFVIFYTLIVFASLCISFYVPVSASAAQVDIPESHPVCVWIDLLKTDTSLTYLEIRGRILGP